MMRAFLVLSLVCGLASAGFLSNTKHAFKEGDAINLKVNGLFSSKTRIPYEYYYLPLPKVGPLRGVWLSRSQRKRSTRHLLSANC